MLETKKSCPQKKYANRNISNRNVSICLKEIYLLGGKSSNVT